MPTRIRQLLASCVLHVHRVAGGEKYCCRRVGTCRNRVLAASERRFLMLIGILTSSTSEF